MFDLDLLIKRLTGHQVEYVVVGGFAAVAHGASLMTQDFGIACRFTADNLMRLQDALADLQPVHRMTPGRLPLSLTPEKCAGLKNLYLSTNLGQLDCLSFIEGVGDFEAVVRQSVEVDLGFGRCRILSLGALIRAKETMGRPRDREAVLQLRAIRERLESTDIHEDK